ncbi:MAG: DNA/RNA nuclease SfsA [Deltaproteobacteria bacterium]|nr:DNA/RNA nuclease SfsA [Deltaproteobacteria bacterium]
MKLTVPLLKGTLVQRRQRFLVDVKLEDESIVTAHTPNTGAMAQCAVAGYPVLLSRSDNPWRQYQFTLEKIHVGDHWVDINPLRANRIVEEALRLNRIGELAGLQARPEFSYGESRIDFLLEGERKKILMEVKSVTLLDEQGVACFPDAVTLRGQKHLRELRKALQSGYRCVAFFLVQRDEACAFRPADHIDPEYGRLLREAVAAGVEILSYKTNTTEEETVLAESLPIILDQPQPEAAETSPAPPDAVQESLPNPEDSSSPNGVKQ